MLKTGIIASALILCAAGSQAKETAPPEMYSQAVQFYENGDFAKALIPASSAVEDDKRFYPARALRAEIFLEMGNRKHANGDAEFILSDLGDSPDTRAGAENVAAQAEAFFIKGESGRAAEDFDSLLPGESSPEALDQAARVYASLGKYREAMDRVSAAVLSEHCLLFYRDKALIEIQSGLYHEAVLDLISVLRFAPEFPRVYDFLGDALAGGGDGIRAKEAYEKALRLDAHDEFSDIGLARLNLNLGLKEQALEEFEAALKFDPSGYAPRLAEAEALFKNGDEKSALSDYESAFSSEDFPAQKAELVGQRLLRAQDYQQALEAYGRAADFFQGAAPDEIGALLGESEASEKMGNFAGALKFAKQARKLDEKNQDVLIEMARIEYQLGKIRKAKSEMNEAVALNPQNPKALIGRGELFFRLKKEDLALADFNSAISLDSSAAQAYNDRAVLYSDYLGNYKGAQMDLQAAISLDPKNPEFYFNLGLLEGKEDMFELATQAFGNALVFGGPMELILKNRAEVYSRLGDRVDAMNDIQAALEQSPEDASVYIGLGRIYYRAADYEDAQESFEKALEIDPRNPDASLGMGQIYGAQGLIKKALRAISAAADADSSSAEIEEALCEALRANEDTSSSIEACSEAISLDPGRASAYFQRALGEISAGEFDKALEDLKQARSGGLRIPEEFLAQAVAHAALGRYQEAHKDYEEARTLDPDTHQISVNLAPPSANPEGFYDSLDSVELFENPNVVDPYAFILRGDALSNAGHCDGAIEEFSRALQIGGDIADAYVGRARCLGDQGEYDQAMEDLQTVLSSASAESDIYNEQAQILIMEGSYPDALAAEIKAVHFDPSYSDAYLEAGHVRYFMKKYKKAVANYTLAVKVDPMNPRNYDGLGLGLFALGRYADAVENFSEAIALNPRDADFYKNRASAYANMGNYRNALEDFRTGSILNTDPEAVKDYNRLIEETSARLAQGKS